QVPAINIIVPSTVGGSTDNVARLVAPEFSKELGVPVVVINRPGASGTIGAAAIAKAKPDGQTIGITFDSQATNHLMFKNLSYDTFKSFEYVTLLVSSPHLLVTGKDYKNFK